MPITTPLREVIAIPPRATPEFDEDLMYGIELEYENVRTERCPALWNLTGDGSLRNNGVEYVSRTLTRNQLPEAIATMEEHLGTINADPNVRCGIHVHLNMRPRTIGELYAFITAYTLLEPAIFEHWCPERLTSSFCVPVYRNMHMLMRLHQVIQSFRTGAGRSIGTITGTSKYSALNVASLSRFCTVELRMLPATTDMNELQSWLDTLTRLYDNSVRYTDPLQVIALYEGLRFRGFARTMLGLVIDPPDDQAAAERAATVIAGYEEPTWQELTWDQPQENV